MPLGTALGEAVPGDVGVGAGVVWAEAALRLHRPAASSMRENFMGKEEMVTEGVYREKTAKVV